MVSRRTGSHKKGCEEMMSIFSQPFFYVIKRSPLLLALLYVCILIAGLAGKNHLSHADALWCHFHQFVIIDPFQCRFQGELAAWRQLDGFIGAGSTGIGEVLLLAGVHVHILVSGVFAHNHAFVYLPPVPGRVRLCPEWSSGRRKW